MGKLCDDRGNLMSPSFSSKNGLRYRFYVSSALLRGKKSEAGPATRIPAAAIENAVRAALREHQGQAGPDSEPAATEMLERIVVSRDQLLLKIACTDEISELGGASKEIRIAGLTQAKASAVVIEAGRQSGKHA